MTASWDRTSETITVNERNYRLRALNEIIVPSRYDNALFDDTIKLRDPDLLGTDEALTAYRARSNGQPEAAILTVIAPDGYSGPIRLLVGINYDGTLAGVRVAEHNETPGLGDKIELKHSTWIKQFEGQSLQQPPAAQWDVRSKGGAFDKLTGATITPRAVIKAVRNALLYFDANRELVFSSTTDEPAIE